MTENKNAKEKILKPLNEELLSDHSLNHPEECPFCHEQTVVFSDSVKIYSYHELSRNVSCSNPLCKKTWFAFYDLRHLC